MTQNQIIEIIERFRLEAERNLSEALKLVKYFNNEKQGAEILQGLLADFAHVYDLSGKWLKELNPKK